MSPFKSKSQQKGCYATGGFGGKVNCKKWSKETKSNNLPAKVKKKK